MTRFIDVIDDRLADARGPGPALPDGQYYSAARADNTVAPATLSAKAELVADRLEHAVCRLRDIRYKVHGEADSPEPAQSMPDPVVSSGQKPDPVRRSVNRALAKIEALFSQIEKLEKTL